MANRRIFLQSLTTLPLIGDGSCTPCLPLQSPKTISELGVKPFIIRGTYTGADGLADAAGSSASD